MSDSREGMTINRSESGAARLWAGMAAGWTMDLLVAIAVVFGAARLAAWRWPLAGGQLAYGFGLAAVAVTGWRWWRLRSDAARAEPLAEPVRVLLVAAAAMGVMAPMFTHLPIGGTDARWYALMLHDFIEQWRTAGPPVFLGQGEFVWNGAVHPFRSAPVYMHVAGLWDWLTFRSLDVGALQHLTAITAALAGAWGTYAAGVSLAPRHRWMMAGLAAIYVMSAAALVPLYMADAYMTYMASAAFVLVFYGNARVLTDGRGWISLAAGLSLAWMSHPPTALQVTILTAFIQVGGLVFIRGTGEDWGRAAAGGAVFLLLSAYYFTGMSELPKTSGGNVKVELLQVGSLLAGWAAAARFFLMKKGWPWALVLLVAIGTLGFTCAPWAAWLALLALLLGAVRAAGRGNRFSLDGREALVMLGGILLTALAMDALLRSGSMAKPGYPVASLQWAAAWSAMRLDYLLALGPNEVGLEPGWGLWFGGIVAGLIAFRRQEVATQLLFGAVVLMCPLVLHLPRAGDFFVEYIPEQLKIMTAAPMHLRTIPVLTALLVACAILAGRAEPAGGRRFGRWLMGGIVLLATGWYAWQGRIFVRRGFAVTSSPEQAMQNWRSENAPMDRFVYDLLTLPSYFSHGKMDPRLEVRLLDDRGNLIYGPPQVMEAMEAAGSTVLDLNTHAIAGTSAWLQLEPRFTLQPGERRLLRFGFDPERRFSGYLMFFSEHGYREYRLPESGMSRAFGTGPAQARVISLWNSGTTPEHYHMQLLLGADNELKGGMPFATLILAPFRPELALIEVKSLNPWRVETRLPWSGQLETPRVYLPGYEVRVDGRRIGSARISASPDRLLQIAMPPGEHSVEVRYVGTWKLRLAGVISLAAWLIVLAIWLGGSRWKLGARLAI